MPFKIFRIPISNPEEFQNELNQHLRSSRIIEISKEFVDDGPSSYWCFCVESVDSKERHPTGTYSKSVDYRETLSAEDFEKFAALRSLRKEFAEKEKISPYLIFTNEQLAQMVQQNVQSELDMKKIPGIGEQRSKKYAEPFLKTLLGGEQGVK